ncbi:N-acetyltransferase GCN5 [Galbibacter marinus]|uniref:N-acetyltransferase GCN5 n=1 Tax=Galbibacter marinus TaxID=555500 RepID=K2P2S0_9FLAO|nr:GNAT family N-acetyltransferase [Galbibacter marinus]EKF55293.1 N-acetyltransferase GCN5 [Galbibacter marinus]
MNDIPILKFELASSNDSQLLTDTAFKSKGKWNYTEEQMALWTNELTITKSYIGENKVFKILDNKNYVGFFALILKDKFIEIDHFWLLPENTEKGYGMITFNFIKRTAQRLNYKILRVYSEPYVNGFYSKMGGKIIHSKESKIKGRFLDIYEFEIF